MEPLDTVARYPEVFAALPVRKFDGEGGWDLPCPCATNHKRNDKRWSARVWEDGDRLRFWCGRGCQWADAVAQLGVTKRAWFRRDPSRIPMDYQLQIAARYRYEDHSGLLFEVVRTNPKGFHQRRPGPNGKGWVYDLRECYVLWREQGGKWDTVRKGTPGAVHLPEVRRVLYRYPELRRRTQEPVLVVEGEKAADELASLGFLATCSPLGAGKWRGEYGGFLAGRHVIVFPDNDLPGLDHAERVVGSAITSDARSVRVIRNGLPGYSLPEGGDIYDWLQTQGDPAKGAIMLREERKAAVKRLVQVPIWSTQPFVARAPAPVIVPATAARKGERKGMKGAGTAGRAQLPDSYTRPA